ncbi:MAG: GTP 3',8-cyclase MoaA [Reinekea forsetii]|nr:GTP 3',8-cyclase MoaA [Reinekea forsetii]
MLQDTFGRRFYYLRLSVTDVCNFSCDYCLPDGYQGRPDEAFLSPNELTQVARGFAAMGTQKIRLTGGEPSLRNDLPEIIERIHAIEGIQTVALTTNGYKLPQRIKTWADAGLTQLNVSIDSLDPNEFQRITGHDRLPEILAGITEAKALGLAVKVNSVLMKDINDDMSAVLHWLRTNPVTLRFIEVMETADQQVFFRQHHISGATIKERLLVDGWQPVARKLADGPAQEFWHPAFVGRIGLIMPYSKDFCATCNRLRVSSLGKLHLCLFSEQGIDLRPLLQPGVPLSGLVEAVTHHLGDKSAGHSLIDHNSGAMANLSQIGG